MSELNKLQTLNPDNQADVVYPGAFIDTPLEVDSLWDNTLNQLETADRTDLTTPSLETNSAKSAEPSPNTLDNFNQPFLAKHLRIVKYGAAALLSSIAAFGSSDIALAAPSKNLASQARPLRFLTQVEDFYRDTVVYGEAISSEGAMNYVEHMKIQPHSFEIVGACNVNTNNNNYYNDVRFVLSNLKYDHEISCANGDQPAQNFYFPHSKECVVPSQVNCKDMNLVPILKTVASEAEAYATGLKPKLMSRASFGSVALLLVDQYRSKSRTDARIFFRNQDSSSNTRPVKAISIFTHKGQETANVTFYK